MNLSQITVFCFAASYTVALILELLAVFLRTNNGKFAHSSAGTFLQGSGHLLSRGFVVAGLFAHIAYLIVKAGKQNPPLSSPAEWCLLAALVVVSVAFFISLVRKRWSIGLFLLPIVLGLIGFSQSASSKPFSTKRASAFWGQIHGVSLLLATVVVSLGFVAGLMYLLQSYRLKQKLAPIKGLNIPSLEWLERINARALGLSVWLVAIGFGSGIVLGQIRNQGVDGYSYLTDPAVWSLAAMLIWLLLASLFGALYPAARHGHKVANLTVASFLFLVLAISSITFLNNAHGQQMNAEAGSSSIN